MPSIAWLLWALIQLHQLMLAASFRLRTHRGLMSLGKRNPLPVKYTAHLLHTRPEFEKEAQAKYFEYGRLEQSIQSWWEHKGYFKPSETAKQPEKKFVVPMPPPNVTGYLHMGHAIFLALQDIMVRYHRMLGHKTLWVPGTDHAGIATQLLVEKSLAAKGISRQSLTREEFLDHIWQWKADKGGYILNQMKRLGASADWSREKFTLDPDMNEAVNEAFVRLYEKGLIYKGEYMVNWSPNLQTAVSDLEVEYSEEVGKLYTFHYPLADDSNITIPIATTRPETILGDTAICVHPLDERYSQYIGKLAKVPFVDRLIPIIADDYVDREFGTGALKITPGHDINDYELSKRHQLPIINIMNKDGTINGQGGAKYSGLDRFTCREQIWQDLESIGLAIEVKQHTQRVPRSQRGGEIIEPMVSSQWFVKMKDMADRAIQAAKTEEIRFIPDWYDKIWYNWLENIHDWCISRQLWWGHRIPVYYIHPVSPSQSQQSSQQQQEFIVARSYQEALLQAQEKYGKEVTITQDEDVLDTWFSSGLWPFATVGWPNVSDRNYQEYYPASVMETGYDILFFWVARMVMLGLEFTDKVPFHTVYLHGLVRDGNGQKMSKTKGNVIDPIDTIDQFGCDALRFALVMGSTPGNDVPLAMDKIESCRNFVNKLWNIGKYLSHSFSSLTREELLAISAMPVPRLTEEGVGLAERHILSMAHSLAMDVTRSLERHDYNDATKQLYSFIWDEFADWYIEASKTRMKDPVRGQVARRTLVYVWDLCLKLLHPFMPFITETLWQTMPGVVARHEDDSIMISDWPIQPENLSAAALETDSKAVITFQSLQATIRGIRNIRTDYKVEVAKQIECHIAISDPAVCKAIQQESAVICLLARTDPAKLYITETVGEVAKDAVHLVVQEGIEVYLPLSSLVDVQKEIQRLEKQQEKLLKEIDGFQSKLGNERFVSKAPAALIEETRHQLADRQDQVSKIQASLANYRNKL